MNYFMEIHVGGSALLIHPTKLQVGFYSIALKMWNFRLRPVIISPEPLPLLFLFNLFLHFFRLKGKEKY